MIQAHFYGDGCFSDRGWMVIVAWLIEIASAEDGVDGSGLAGENRTMIWDLLFEVETPLGFVVRCTRTYWEFIITQKHPVLCGREQDIIQVLTDPDVVRQSRKDQAVLLFYRGASPRWLCAVVRRDDGSGFLITAYPTDSLKIGETIWTRSK